MLYLAAKLGTDAAPRLRGVAYSGGVIRPLGFGATAIDLAGLELPAKLPLLADHAQDALHVVGSASPSIESGMLVVRGEVVPGTLVADRLLTLLRAGAPLGLSVGVEVVESRPVGQGKTANVNGRQLTGPFLLVTRGTLREVSVVSVPADRNAGVSLTASKDAEMTDSELMTFAASLGLAPEALTDELKPVLEAAWRQQQELERRVKLAELRASRPSVSAPHQEAERPGLTACVLALAGRADLVARTYGERAAEQIERQRSGGWSGLARQALLAAGQHEHLSTSGTALLKAAFSLTDLPVALTEGVNKLALEAFRELSANWRAVAKTVSVPDFKDGKAVRLSAATRFQQVAPGGEIQHGDLAEETFTVKAATYARLISVDRTSIINDDLSLLSDLPRILASEGARLVSDLVFGELTGAGASFFAAAKGNLLTGASSALSITSLGQAVKALRTQKDRDGRLIGFVPTTLVVPAALEATARQVLNSQLIARTGADQLPQGNPTPPLTLVVEPRLDAASSTAWYLFARAEDGALLAAFLNDNQAPVVEEVDTPAERLGVTWRAYLDCGAALGEYRAVVKSNGA